MTRSSHVVKDKMESHTSSVLHDESVRVPMLAMFGRVILVVTSIIAHEELHDKINGLILKCCEGSD